MLSKAVSKALTLRGGHETEETARFLHMMDKYFDYVNVCNFNLEFVQLYYISIPTAILGCRRSDSEGM